MTFLGMTILFGRLLAKKGPSSYKHIKQKGPFQERALAYPERLQSFRS
jgi:hypothetical protein